MKKTLGYTLLSSPFIALFLLCLKYIGLIATLAIFGGVLFTVILIGLSVHLIME